MAVTDSTMNKIRKLIFPDSKQTDLTSDILSSAIQNINKYKSNSGRVGYVNMMKTLITKTDIGNIDTGIFGASHGMGGVVTPELFGQTMRLARYALYESIAANIPYCNRALSVLCDNILSPDDITKIALIVKQSDEESNADETDYHVKTVKKIIFKVDLEKHLEKIIKNTLKMGDFFMEIADSRTALTSQSFIADSNINIDRKNEKFQILDENIDFTEKIGKKEKKYSFNKKILLDFSAIEDETKSTHSKNDEIDLLVEKDEFDDYESVNGIQENKKKKADIDTSSLSNINFLFHQGKHIIKLQSEMYSICFGYLIFPKVNMLRRLNPQEEALNDLCNRILKKVYEQIPNSRDSLHDPEEMKSIIANILMRNSLSGNNIAIRYVPPEKMIHFKMPSEKFYPYGESIFDCVAFPCKLLMALEVALAIQRINRSTEKRKIGVEIGLPRDAKKIIEGLKEELNKRKISMGDFQTIDSIPSAISTFEDIYVPQKDGVSYFNIEPINDGVTDTRSKVDELKLIRDTIVAGLNVIPSAVGLEENLSNKNALSHESIFFARHIINLQKLFSELFTEVIEKILNIVSPDNALTFLDDVVITFPMPRSLQYENEARWTTDMVSMIQSLKDLGIPLDYLKKKYLTNIDWDEVKKHETDEKLEKEFTNADDVNPEDDPMGMGGMGGIGGMGTPGGMGY